MISTKGNINGALNSKQAIKGSVSTEYIRLKAEEVDPTVPEYVKAITEEDIAKWNSEHVYVLDLELDNYYLNNNLTIKSDDTKEKIRGLLNQAIKDNNDIDNILILLRNTKMTGRDYVCYWDAEYHRSNSTFKAHKENSVTTFDTFYVGNYFDDRDWQYLRFILNITVNESFTEVTNINSAKITWQYRRLIAESNIGNYALTKTNTTSYTPTYDYHPTTKKYVDDSNWFYKLDIDFSLESAKTLYNKQTTTTTVLSKALSIIKEMRTKKVAKPILLCFTDRQVIGILNPYYYTRILTDTAFYDSTNVTLSWRIYDKIGNNAQDPICCFDIYFSCSTTKASNNFTEVHWVKAQSQGNCDIIPRYNMLSKDNTISYTPTSDYHPATKKYVDDLFSSITNGDEVSY